MILKCFGVLYILVCLSVVCVVVCNEWRNIKKELQIDKIFTIKQLLKYILAIPFIPIILAIQWISDEYGC